MFIIRFLGAGLINIINQCGNEESVMKYYIMLQVSIEN